MKDEQPILPYRDRLNLIRQGLATKTTGPKPKKPISKVSKKRAIQMAAEKENKGDSGLDKYFDYHMEHSSPVCMECGLRADWLLEEKYKFLWRSCQAHVLRKKDSIGGFPSVAINLTNHLVLFPKFANLCGHHDDFDSSYEKMAKMKVFPQAIDIITQLYPLIKADERKYLPEIITQEIKPEIYNSK